MLCRDLKKGTKAVGLWKTEMTPVPQNSQIRDEIDKLFST